MNFSVDELNGRFKDAPWYEGCKSETIYLVGLGGIGSNFLYNCTKTIPCNYFIQDIDTVDSYNIGTQFFSIGDIGKNKTNASIDSVKRYVHNPSIIQATTRYDGFYKPIMIAALDNMATRKQMFESWKSKSGRELFIDARLRANFYEIFTVTPGMEEEYEKTLFDDGDVDDGPCTFKATTYFGMLCGARMVHILTNYFSNKYSEDKIYTVPYEVREFGDLMFFEAK